MIENVAYLEQAVVGGVLLDPNNIDLMPTLRPEHFSTARGRHVWQAILTLRETGAPIDLATVGDELHREGDRNEVTWEYLGECAANVPTPENAVEYAGRVREEALHRQVLATCAEITEKARQGTFGLDLLGDSLKLFSCLDGDSVASQSMSIGEIIRARFETLQNPPNNGGLTGFPTGVADLDKLTGGWQPGIVSIVAARPGHGKSSLGLSTTDACSRGGFGVHVFSLEDTRDSYADRVMSRSANISAEDIRRHEFKRGQIDDLSRSVRELVKRKGWLVDDRSGIAADEIVREVRRHKRENQTKVVIVDYLQLVKRQKDMTSHESIGANLNILADAAKNDGMAYVVMSQLNREVEKRDDRRPLVSDMRESGTIEERAKCIIGCYRGIYKNSPQSAVDTHDNGSQMTANECANSIQLMILKNSNGVSPARVVANWHGATTNIW